MKQTGSLPAETKRGSPGFIGREWIETVRMLVITSRVLFSPGFIGREWIETRDKTGIHFNHGFSPGFIGREWIETR